ncbi:MAG: hypothetical protein V4651_14460 [Bacteroidota bacterium]
MNKSLLCALLLFAIGFILINGPYHIIAQGFILSLLVLAINLFYSLVKRHTESPNQFHNTQPWL